MPTKIVGNWAIAPFPEEATGMKQMSIWCVAVSKYSQNKEAAFEWLKEYSSPEHQTQFYEEFGVLPSLTSFWEQPEVKDSVIGPLARDSKNVCPSGVCLYLPSWTPSWPMRSVRTCPVR